MLGKHRTPSPKRPRNTNKKRKARNRFRSKNANDKTQVYLSKGRRQPASLSFDHRLLAKDVEDLCALLTGTAAETTVMEEEEVKEVPGSSKPVAIDDTSDEKIVPMPVDQGDGAAESISSPPKPKDVKDVTPLNALKSLALVTTKIRPSMFEQLLNEGLAKTKSLAFLSIVGEHHILHKQWIALAKIIESPYCPVHTLTLRNNRYWEKNRGAPTKLARALVNAPNLRHLSVDKALQEQVVIALADKPTTTNLKHLYLCSDITTEQSEKLKAFLLSDETWLDALTIRGKFEDHAARQRVLQAVHRNKSLFEWSIWDCSKQARHDLNLVKRSKTIHAGIRGLSFLKKEQDALLGEVLKFCKDSCLRKWWL